MARNQTHVVLNGLQPRLQKKLKKAGIHASDHMSFSETIEQSLNLDVVRALMPVPTETKRRPATLKVQVRIQ